MNIESKVQETLIPEDVRLEEVTLASSGSSALLQVSGRDFTAKLLLEDLKKRLKTREEDDPVEKRSVDHL